MSSKATSKVSQLKETIAKMENLLVLHLTEAFEGAKPGRDYAPAGIMRKGKFTNSLMKTHWHQTFDKHKDVILNSKNPWATSVAIFRNHCKKRGIPCPYAEGSVGKYSVLGEIAELIYKQK